MQKKVFVESPFNCLDASKMQVIPEPHEDTVVQAQTLPALWPTQPVVSTFAHWHSPWPNCNPSPDLQVVWPDQICVRDLWKQK